MANARLTATPRTEAGKGAARALRREGRIPAVVYGRNRESLPLSVNTRELERLLGQIVAASTVIDLELDNGDRSRTLIREIQRHPFKRTILHVDFQELVAGERVTVRVPIVLQGTPPGVRLGGGMLDQVLYEVELECDPGSIPSHVELDVSELQVSQALHVGSLPLPEGVVVLDDAGLTVCTVQPPRVSEASTDEEGAAQAEPEVIRRAKEDDEAE